VIQLFFLLFRLKKNIIFNEDSLLGEISFKTFFEQVGGDIDVVVEKNKESHEVKYMKRANSKEFNKY